MIGWFEALLLGVVQGITEYLPVSSSGHLVIAQHLFGMKEPALFFDIILHMGTLSAVVWYYYGDLRVMAIKSFSAISKIGKGESLKDICKADDSLWFVVAIVIATIPTGFIGVLFKEDFEKIFNNVTLVGYMLLVTGFLLLITIRRGENGKGDGEIKIRDALVIGLVQGLSITPGISRSGSTIAAALLLGIKRESAAKFSFLMSLPSIVGALVLQARYGLDAIDPVSAGIGFTASTITGCICLAFLVAIVKRGGLAWFSIYCFAAGLFTLFFIVNI
jgi:undecaprenyl-diphosphatase